jgi:molybdopterin/thiamine biosynthesis adenylyltransferase
MFTTNRSTRRIGLRGRGFSGERLSRPADVPETISSPDTYFEQVYRRHRGIISEELQRKLWNTRVLVAGAGSVGSFHAFALARLGIRKFVLTDPERYEISNLARQDGATLETLGQWKAEAVRDRILTINPHAEVLVEREGVNETNVARLLEGVNVIVDSIEFYELEARCALLREAQRRGLPLVSACPIGFGTNMLVFRPGSMSYEKYFDFDSCQTRKEKLANFALGLSPKLNGFRDLDLTKVSASGESNAPSLALAASLASAVVSTTVVRLIEDASKVEAAPCSFALNVRGLKIERCKLRWGNRSPLQKLRRRILLKLLGK